MTDEIDKVNVISLGTERSRRSGNAADWSARDIVVEMLRMIDEEGGDFDTIVISYRRTKNKDGETVSGFLNQGPDIQTSLGLLECTKLRMWEFGG